MAEVKELKEQINVVVEAREKSRLLSDKRKSMYDAFMGEHTDFFAEVATAVSEVVEAESTLREMALQVYTETGNKAPEIGVGIRVRTVLDYEDNEAFLWGLEHKLALKLDASAFEKIAKTSNLPFVTITEEPSATIATELNKVE